MRAGALIIIALIAGGCDYHGRPLTGDDDVADAAGDDTIDAPPGDIDATITTFDAEIDGPIDAPVPPDAAPDAAPDAPPACPDGYVQLDGAPLTSRYRVAMVFVRWAPAETACDNDGVGTHLVVVDDAAESAAIDAAFFGDFWLGATDRVTEGTFLSVTGGPAPYLNWAFLQPDDFFGQDCVGLDEGGSYSDRGCDANRGYVCECDGVEPDPTAF